MSRANVIDIGYLVAAVLFIVGLKGLGRPRTAPRGNLMGATGMFIAVLVTMVDKSILSYQSLAIGLALGVLIGALLALRVQMTSMPELVVLFNGFGGGASHLNKPCSGECARDRGACGTENHAGGSRDVSWAKGGQDDTLRREGPAQSGSKAPKIPRRFFHHS